MIRSRLFWAIIAIATLAVFHAPILRGCAWLLIIDQRDVAVDCVVIAGGDGRFDVAAGWVRGDPKRRILLIQERPERIVELGILPSAEAVVRRELAKRQVPDERIELISGAAQRGGDAVHALPAWLPEHPELRVAMLCERFASRDLRLRINAAVASDVAGRIDLWALPDRRYDEQNWWHNRPAGHPEPAGGRTGPAEWDRCPAPQTQQGRNRVGDDCRGQLLLACAS